MSSRGSGIVTHVTKGALAGTLKVLRFLARTCTRNSTPVERGAGARSHGHMKPVGKERLILSVGF